MSEPTAAAARAMTVYFDPNRNRFISGLSQTEGRQQLGRTMERTSVADPSIVAITHPDGVSLLGLEGDKPTAYLNQVAAPLFNAIQARGTLKVRVFDPNNRGIQAEILKLVQMAAGSGPDAEAAWIILKHVVAQNPTLKPFLLMAFASVMGGAEWIQKDAEKFRLDNPGDFSAPAIQAFLKLSEDEDILSHDDCMEIHQQLEDYQSFSREDSVLLQTIRSGNLTIAQREQLGDRFGQHPRSVYAKSREYFSLGNKFTELKRRVNDYYQKNPKLKDLMGNFECFGIDLRKNDFKVPTSLDSLHLREGTFSKERLDKAQAAIEEFLPVWQKFQVDPNDLSLTPDQLALCKAVQEAQVLSTNGGETADSLTRKMSDLAEKLPSRCDYLTYQANFPPEEAALRRTLMAGRPNATLEDCWDAIIPEDKQSKELGAHREWTAEIRKYHMLWRHFQPQEPGKIAIQDFSGFLMEVAEHAQQYEKFYAFFQKKSIINPLEKGIFYQLGGIPKRCNPFHSAASNKDINLTNLLSQRTQSLLKEINRRLHPGEEFSSKTDHRLGIEKYLKEHPEMDATQRRQIEEILKIAAKMKVES